MKNFSSSSIYKKNIIIFDLIIKSTGWYYIKSHMFENVSKGCQETSGNCLCNVTTICHFKQILSKLVVYIRICKLYKQKIDFDRYPKENIFLSMLLAFPLHNCKKFKFFLLKYIFSFFFYKITSPFPWH